MKGGAEVVLRRGPGEGHPLAGVLLESLGEDGHGLLKTLCPSLPLSQGPKGGAEVVLRRGPVEGHPLAGALLESLGEGGHGLLKTLCPSLPLSQGHESDAERHMQRGAARRFDRTAFEQGGDLLGDAVQALFQHPAAYFRSSERRRNSQRLGGELRAEVVVEVIL